VVDSAAVMYKPVPRFVAARKEVAERQSKTPTRQQIERKSPSVADFAPLSPKAVNKRFRGQRKTVIVSQKVE
jgi:hypothetical protein